MRSLLEGFRERLRIRRDRLIADPRFQRWSLHNPLTLPLARRKARAALDLTAGFVYSQVLFACARLNLFEALRERPLSVADLAARLALSQNATRRLLDAATALDLAQRRSGDRYGLGEIGAAFAGNPAALSLVLHQPLVYADLADPVALLRGEKRAQLADYWPYSDSEAPRGLRAEAVASYSALMAASQSRWSRRRRSTPTIFRDTGACSTSAAARACSLQRPRRAPRR